MIGQEWQMVAVRSGRILVAGLVWAVLIPWQALAAIPVLISEASSRTQTEVTVYNDNLALIREVRHVALPKGDLHLEFRDVPAQIEPRSLLIETMGRGDLKILEQNYEFDLMSQEKILEKYVGKQISWIQEDGERIEGRLLGMRAGPVYEVDSEVLFEVPGRIALPQLPVNLRALPTLVWRARSGRGGDEKLDVSYLTRGLSWSADYVLQLDKAGDLADLQSWVSLDNRCGATFAEARLLLVAGEIHQVPPEMALEGIRMAMASKADYAEGVQEESLYDYHLYTLPGQTTLKDSQIKQVALYAAEGIKVNRRYRLESQPGIYHGAGPETMQQKVRVFYAFDNRESNSLGIPLPAGVFRVYGQAGSGGRQLLGEDRIQHTPKDEEVELEVGLAFDLIAERVRQSYRSVGDRTHESAFAITIRNHKDEDVVVEVRESVGGDWRILEASHPHVKLSSRQVRFDLPVAANGQAVLTYSVQVTY